jgi:hypothetical protein
MEKKTAEALKKVLRRAWGDDPCEHSKVEEEAELGDSTGRWFCLSCGREVEPPPWHRR